LNIAVVYYSKTGNTKTIADCIAKSLGCESNAINLMKHGRKTKHKIDQEKQLFKHAVEKCNQSDFLFIGTPTEFRKPHNKIIDLINNLTVKRVAIFCTYYGMLGATFYDLEALLLQKNISIINKLNLAVGTKKYEFNLDVAQYKDNITLDHLQVASDFALRTVRLDKPLSIRLKGICGINCQQCNNFNKSCKGAGFNCWSGRHCDIFNCCVIKKSYSTCQDCSKRYNCILIKKQKNFA
jgi:flavodoxin